MTYADNILKVIIEVDVIILRKENPLRLWAIAWYKVMILLKRSKLDL